MGQVETVTGIVIKLLGYNRNIYLIKWWQEIKAPSLYIQVGTLPHNDLEKIIENKKP